MDCKSSCAWFHRLGCGPCDFDFKHAGMTHIAFQIDHFHPAVKRAVSGVVYAKVDNTFNDNTIYRAVRSLWVLFENEKY